jgi:hypothetical protein
MHGIKRASKSSAPKHRSVKEQATSANAEVERVGRAQPIVPRRPLRSLSKAQNEKLFADRVVDGRTAWARRFRDLIAVYVEDLGGEDNLSAAEKSLCRRIATITGELELLERKFALANGATAVELEFYIRCAGGLRRLLEAIGLKRRARDVSPPTIAEIAAEIAKERQPEPDDEDAADDSADNE